MATRTLKARVELDGEKEYKQALSELNQGNRVLASEMRKLQAQYKDSTESTEFLTKRGELLERQILQQVDKVKTLKAAMQESAEQYGESDARTQQWATRLNDAQTELINLSRGLRENEAAIESEDAAMTGLGDTVQGLASKLGIQLPEGTTKALNGVKGLSAGTVAAMTAAAAGVAALMKTVQQLHQMTLDAAKDVDDIITNSMVTGLSERTLQELQYAENLIDVSVDTISGSLTRLTRNIIEADTKNNELAQSFYKMRVYFADAEGEIRKTEDVFYDIIDALGKVENVTERDALAMDLLGRSAQELNPLIIQGSDALRELAAEAEAAGYILDESQIKKLGEVDDEYQRLQLTVEEAKKEIAADFAPASKEAMELFARAVKSASEMLTQSGIVENFASLLRSVTSMIDAGASLAGAMPKWMNPITQVSKAMEGLAYTMALVADAANIIAGIMPWNWGSGRAKTALGLNARYGEYSNLQKLDGTADEYEEWRKSSYSGQYNSVYGYDPQTGRYYDKKTGNYIYGYNATGNDNWRGGLTWVGETGPELAELPAGTRILSAQQSRRVAGGDTFIFNIDPANIREFNDLVQIAESARVVARMR